MSDGRDPARAHPSASTAMHRPTTLQLLDLTGRLGAATPDQLATLMRADPTVMREIIEDLLQRRLVRIIETVSTLRALRPPAGQGRHPRAALVTDDGWARVLEAERVRAGTLIARPRPPRADQIVHHLLVVAALVELLAVRPGAELMTLAGDEDLRSESRRSQRMVRGARIALLPDARITLRAADGALEEIAVEILVSKYTSDDIRAKHTALPVGTHYYAPTARLCRRVAALGCPTPRLLTA